MDHSINETLTLLTPALAIYVDMVEHNIKTTLRLLSGNANRWRPHIKTTKLSYVTRMLVSHGVTAFKCATTLELLKACEVGARDVLLAFPAVGPTALRVVEIARQFPDVRISVLIDNEAQLGQWSGTSVGAFVDINPGMNRTGVSQDEPESVIKLAKEIRASGIRFRGLHYYDGHIHDLDMGVRTVKAHAGYDRLLQVVREMQSRSVDVEEVVTAGTPVFPCTLSYAEFETSPFLHRASPGTIIYGDVTSDSQLPAEYGYKWAALVLVRAVSYPAPDIVTCDGGHKAVSVDSGVPNCRVLGWDNLTPAHPSEEHLPISVASGTHRPSIGDLLYLVPKHVCPTVNNFSEALLIANGEIAGLGDVSARGHEPPLFDIRKQGDTAGAKGLTLP